MTLIFFVEGRVPFQPSLFFFVVMSLPTLVPEKEEEVPAVLSCGFVIKFVCCYLVFCYSVPTSNWILGLLVITLIPLGPAISYSVYHPKYYPFRIDALLLYCMSAVASFVSLFLIAETTSRNSGPFLFFGNPGMSLFIMYLFCFAMVLTTGLITCILLLREENNAPSLFEKTIT